MDKLSRQQKAMLIEITRLTDWYEAHPQEWPWLSAVGVPWDPWRGRETYSHSQAASMSRTLQRLVARGLVQHQRWYRTVQLTARGRAIGTQLMGPNS